MTRQYKQQRQRYPFDSMCVGDKETFSYIDYDDVVNTRSAAHMISGKRGWKFETKLIRQEGDYVLVVSRVK